MKVMNTKYEYKAAQCDTLVSLLAVSFSSAIATEQEQKEPFTFAFVSEILWILALCKGVFHLSFKALQVKEAILKIGMTTEAFLIFVNILYSNFKMI